MSKEKIKKIRSLYTLYTLPNTINNRKFRLKICRLSVTRKHKKKKFKLKYYRQGFVISQFNLSNIYDIQEMKSVEIALYIYDLLELWLIDIITENSPSAL